MESGRGQSVTDLNLAPPGDLSGSLTYWTVLRWGWSKSHGTGLEPNQLRVVDMLEAPPVHDHTVCLLLRYTC